jgi:hypothetical protein
MPATDNLDDYSKQASVLNVIVAFHKADPRTQLDFSFGSVAYTMSGGMNGYQAVAFNAQRVFNITIDPDVLHRYIDLMRTPAPSAQISAFLIKMNADPALAKQVLAAGSNYDAVQRVAAANGLAVTSADLASYIDPWRVLLTLLRGLLERKVITEEQFQKYADYPSSTISGFGPDVDRGMMAGLLSASRWATKSTNLSNLSMPIAVIVFPSTAVIIGGLEGQQFTFGQLGSMIQQSFSDALDGMATAVDNFHNSVNSVFNQ